MSIPVSWRINAEVGGGPAQSAGGTLRLDGYDQVRVVVKPGPDDSKTVSVQPDETDLRFLLITSSAYGAELTLAVGAEDSVSLDQPILRLGEDAQSFLAGQSLKLINATAGNVTLSILAGWLIKTPGADEEGADESDNGDDEIPLG